LRLNKANLGNGFLLSQETNHHPAESKSPTSQTASLTVEKPIIIIQPSPKVQKINPFVSLWKNQSSSSFNRVQKSNFSNRFSISGKTNHHHSLESKSSNYQSICLSMEKPIIIIIQQSPEVQLLKLLLYQWKNQSSSSFNRVQEFKFSNLFFLPWINRLSSSTDGLGCEAAFFKFFV